MTDAVGAQFLSGAKQGEMSARAKFIFEIYLVTIQEAIQDSFESLGAEVQALLTMMEQPPVAVVVHGGAKYIGDPGYNRDQI